MSEDRKRKIVPAPRALALAALAGAFAGAVAVYVRDGLPGNNAASPAPVAAAAADTDACAGKAGKAAQVAAAAKGGVAAMLAADPPQSLSALAFNGADGKPMTLANRSGKTLLVNLWATWCAPCRAEMPALDALQKDAGGDDFEVMAINVDTGSDEKPRKFLAETGASALAYYREPTLALFNDVRRRGLALGLPVTMLVDAQGCLLAYMNGPAAWDSPDAKPVIAAAKG